MPGCADALMNRERGVSRKKKIQNCGKKISKQPKGGKRGKLMDVRCLSASELLHDRCRRYLRYANTLRPRANGDDTIWQQMTFENFSRFLKNKSLYFRAYGEYTDYIDITPSSGNSQIHSLCP